MPQAVVDPDELRQFARKLKKFNTSLEENLSNLSNELSVLGSTWRDQEHKKFVAEFEQHVKMIGRFLELTQRHVPYLARKADQIDEYLNS